MKCECEFWLLVVDLRFRIFLPPMLMTLIPGRRMEEESYTHRAICALFDLPSITLAILTRWGCVQGV